MISKKYLNFRTYQQGLTLLELVVVIAMIGVLVIAAFGFLNPAAQFQKSDDGKRKSEIAQITTALDTYYNDYSCYPATIPFGSQWIVSGTTYMAQVPQSQDCLGGDGSACYLYAAAGACPQWNVIFAKMSSPSSNGNSCALAQACLPQNYSDEWYCTVSGNVDCSVLSTYSLPVDDEQFCPANQRNYRCTGGASSQCNSVPDGTGTYCASNCDGAC